MNSTTEIEQNGAKRDPNEMAIKVGDIVSVRHRLWRVDFTNNDKKLFTATNIDGGDPRQQSFYYPLEKVKEAAVPKPSVNIVGDAASNKLLMQSFRYSILHGSAPLLSLQRSCVLPTNYQLVPVVMALNKSQRVRMLIADDVGLGKTIEAGLIATELMARNLVSRILVICPKNLTAQWKDALSSFFQIDAKIMSSVDRRVLERTLPPGASPWRHYPHLVCSIDYAKRDAVQNLVLEVPWDLVIVDEAHLAAKPHQDSEKQSVSMERYNFISKLAKSPQVKHLLLLTATPHNGYTDTYASLMDMLDCGIVTGPQNAPHIHKDIAKEHVCQRRRKDVEDWFKKQDNEKSPFPSRKQEDVIIELNDIEKEISQKLDDYGKGIIALADKENSFVIRKTARWVVMHLHKRALSSPYSFRKSLDNRLKRVREKIEKNETIEEKDINELQAKANVMDEDIAEDLSDEEVSLRADQMSFGSIAALENEKDELETLIELSKKLDPVHDSKLRRLTDAPNGILRKTLSDTPEHRKIIIFTRYKDTLEYLKKEIPKRMKLKNEIVTVDGDDTDAVRTENLAKFQNSDIGILIATDCISEGINLQHMANQIIHYELPWNPNRLEQRNGRVDRYGQKTENAYIWTLVMNDTLDATIFEVLVKKANKIRVDYGFAPPFFGDDNNIFDMIQELKGVKLTSAQKSLFEFGTNEQKADNSKRIANTGKINPFDDDVIENIKSESFYGQSNVDLSEIRKRLKDTEALIGTQEDFQKFVLNGLKQFGCIITDNEDIHETMRIELSDKLKVTGSENAIKKATFDPKIAIENSDITHLNIGHPAIRRLFELVKIGFFDSKNKDYGRTAIITTSDVSKTTALYYFLVRFSVGTNPISIIEEILPIACNLIDKKPLVNNEIEQLQKAMPARSSHPIEYYQKHLEIAMKDENYRDPFDAVVNEHIATITQDRQILKDKLMKDSNKSPEWLDGFTNIKLASHDLIAVRLYEPVPKVG